MHQRKIEQIIKQIVKIDDPYDLGIPIADLVSSRSVGLPASVPSASVSSASVSSASVSSASVSSASRFRMSKLQQSLAFAAQKKSA
jgi:hypothetical protein